MLVKKSLNANAVIAVDNQQQEFILFGKGIGYGKKNGDKVDESIVNQTFMPLNNTEIKEYVQLLEAIPITILDATRRIVSEAEKRLNTKLNPMLYIMLSDHLNFAIERAMTGINITNRAFWEMKNYYPEEFDLGLFALQVIDQQMNIVLPEEEAANIAFHLINAQTAEGIKKDGLNYANLISSMTTILRHSMGQNIDIESVHYQRFITHLKFFAERFFADKMLIDDNSKLFETVATAYPKATEVAFTIKDYLTTVYDKKMTKEELTFLIVHINRLRNAQEIDLKNKK